MTAVAAEDGVHFAEEFVFIGGVGLGGGFLSGFGFGAGVAVLLELEDGAAEAGKGVGKPDVGVGVGITGGRGPGEVTEEFANAGGGDLEAGFGELDRVAAVQGVGESFPADAHFLEPGLVLEPVLVAGTPPIRDVVGGDALGFGAKVLQDLAIGNAVIEHLVESLADGPREPGDFAAATAVGFGWVEG